MLVFLLVVVALVSVRHAVWRAVSQMLVDSL
jgi:hypothetical protein